MHLTTAERALLGSVKAGDIVREPDGLKWDGGNPLSPLTVRTLEVLVAKGVVFVGPDGAPRAVRHVQQSDLAAFVAGLVETAKTTHEVAVQVAVGETGADLLHHLSAGLREFRAAARAVAELDAEQSDD